MSKDTLHVPEAFCLTVKRAMLELTILKEQLLDNDFPFAKEKFETMYVYPKATKLLPIRDFSSKI